MNSCFFPLPLSVLVCYTEGNGMPLLKYSIRNRYRSVFQLFSLCLVIFGMSVATIAQSSGPAISNVSISKNASGQVRANVTGSGFVKGGSTVEINGVAAQKTKALKNGTASDGSPTRLRATDDRLAAINTSGDQTVFQVLNTASGQRSEVFVANATARPQLTRIQEAAGKAGTTVTTVIEGRNLYGGTVTVSAEGVTISTTTSVNPTQLPVTFVIAQDAVVGKHTVTVTTTAGTAQSETVSFTVTAPDETKPVVSGIDPASGIQGETVNAVISGFRLGGASAVSLSGSGATVAVLPGGTETSFPVAITIQDAAAPGARTLSVTTPNGVSSENVTFTITEKPAPGRTVELIQFGKSPDTGPDIYHMTEVPDGSYVVTQYSTRSLVLLTSTGGVRQVQRNSFLLVSSIAFYSTEVAYTTCVPTILASRSFRSSDFGAEGIAPGNLGGVSNPRYMLGVDGLVSRTFFLSNGGTGEIRFIDPDTRSTGRVIARGFGLSTTDANTRGLEQLAYNKASRTIFALDSSRGVLVAVDEATGNQRVLRNGFQYPFGLVLMPNGNLLVSDRGNGMLTEVTQTGQLVATYDTKQGADALRGLFVNSRGEIFLLVDKTQTIFRVRFN